MVRLFGRRRSVTYCERCGNTCSGQCRAAVRLDRIRDQALGLRWGRP
ncbi:hypothetical protein AB0I55_12250 [Actinocatenispora sera]